DVTEFQITLTLPVCVARRSGKEQPKPIQPTTHSHRLQWECKSSSVPELWDHFTPRGMPGMIDAKSVQHVLQIEPITRSRDPLVSEVNPPNKQTEQILNKHRLRLANKLIRIYCVFNYH